MNHPTATPEKSAVISSLLMRSDSWGVPSLGEPLQRDTMLNRFDSIARANYEVEGVINDDFANAHAISAEFVNKSFDAFEKKIESDQFNWTFAVPARGDETQGEEYASEVTFFLPLLDPKFGVNSMIRQRTVAHLAPTIIETYKGNEAGVKGALVWTPVYFDPKEWNINAARYRTNEAASFVRNTLGAKVMGLGAIMPGLTNYGGKISQEGLVTTTGHGGTVHLVVETVREVAEYQPDNPVVGILGLGSIGHSSLEVLQDKDSAFHARKFIVYDTKADLITKALKSDRSDVTVVPAIGEADLLKNSDIIVTAVTDVIDLNALEDTIGHPLDLTGKTIIDDSQPGCFDRSQVEARGGRLVWVVGEDTSERNTFKRINGYSYGDTGGLYGNRAVWGCEAEAGSIAMSEAYDHAVKTQVNSEIARKVGKICFDAGIRVSSPLQSFGQPVDI